MFLDLQTTVVLLGYPLCIPHCMLRSQNRRDNYNIRAHKTPVPWVMLDLGNTNPRSDRLTTWLTKRAKTAHTSEGRLEGWNKPSL